MEDWKFIGINEKHLFRKSHFKIVSLFWPRVLASHFTLAFVLTQISFYHFHIGSKSNFGPTKLSGSLGSQAKDELSSCPIHDWPFNILLIGNIKEEWSRGYTNKPTALLILPF